MNEDQKRDIGLMRFSIISPLANGIYEGGIKAFFREASKATYINPSGEKVQFSVTTIERWYYKYKKDGFEGLIPQNRIDRGRSRKADDDILASIKYLKSEYPRLPATIIHQKLIENGTIKANQISLSTVNRCVNRLKLNSLDKEATDMRRYERAHINEVWYGDSSVGPWLKVKGKNKRVWIIAMIDDASRMITGIDLFFKDNTDHVFSVLKSAITRHGRPKVCTFDNGSPYKNKQMSLLAARIGFSLNYNKPYTPTQKAKIERFFSTIKSQWLSGLDMNTLDTLDKLKVSLMNYIKTYNERPHGSLNGLSPSDRFYSESSYIKRIDPLVLDQHFLLEIDRTVTADAVIQIDKVEYEVPYHYSGKKIRLRYTPGMKEVYIEDPVTKELTHIKLLNKLDNSKIKREKPKLSGGGTDELHQ
jgi:transposase InsO family protein